MKRKGLFAAIAAVGMLGAAVPAGAADPVADNGAAEKLRRLDIMLMVTALRCRTTPDNFQPEFQDFEASHLRELNDAAADLRNGLVGAYGVTGAMRALDRMSTSMANQYGQGHPWMGCAELKVATRILTSIRTRDALVSAADELLAPSESPQLALASK
jgi:hypothetical protein